MSVTTTALTATPTVAVGPPNGLRLLAHQLRYELRTARRNVVLIGFTLAMPLMMLGIFGLLLGSDTIGPLAMTYRQFFVPNVVVLALLSSCFASLGISLAIRRGTGELKRLRGTPLPPWVALAALCLQAAITGSLVAAVVVACGRWWFGVAPPAVAPFLTLLAVSTLALSAMGVAVATFITRPENGPAATNILLWPVAFISGTFTWVPKGSALDHLASALPVRHLNTAALAATSTGGSHVAWRALAMVAAWGGIGAVVAVRRFRWEPATSA
jgi:ABC-2 type transport system permease protein